MADSVPLRLPVFCYVLVETGETPLCEAAFISCCLLRRLYPTARIVILCDKGTACLITGRKLPFCSIAAQITVIDVPESLDSPAVRSRFLKTQIRNLVEGDLVFLDCDALPLRPFDSLFNHSHQFAAVLDRNKEHPRPCMPDWVKPIYAKFEWTYPLAHYFNSGVMFLKDDPQMRELGRLWHSRWHQVFSTFGKHQDQPALNSSLHSLGINYHVMPVPYNAMVDASPGFARNAKIVHYFFGGRLREFDPDSLLQHLIRDLCSDVEIDWATYEKSISRGDCWIHPTSSIVKEFVARHYLRAAQLLVKRGLNTLKR